MNKGGQGDWWHYTLNPIGGCAHECRWVMPNGKTAICYAEAFAGRMKSATFFPEGFAAHYWHPARLAEPGKVKTPGRIFVGSMADVFGQNVPTVQIQAVLDMCAGAPQHTFIFLTKNAPRLLRFTFPRNTWIGVSSPPDWMRGHQLTDDQKAAFAERALKVLTTLRRGGVTTWMSIEPLTFMRLPGLIEAYRDALAWAVVGAASDGPRTYQPQPELLRQMFGVLACPVYTKGNLDESVRAGVIARREEFPAVSAPADANDTTQLALL